MCRIALGAPVPPPRDWSELTGNIPVITAPLLDERAEAQAAAPVPAPGVVPAPASAPAAESLPAADRETAAAPLQHAASVPASSVPPAAPAVVPPAFAHPVAAVAPMQTADPVWDLPIPEPARLSGQAIRGIADVADADADLPGWRAPDDPTLRVFADRLDETRRRGRSRSSVRKRRRRLVRLLVWVVGLCLVVGFLLLAPTRLPFL
jgi:hypothetical protein